jgi:RimJ/RimL family protein N-acetyltransferase
MNWLAEVKGKGVVGRIRAEVVVPTARRGMIYVDEWDGEHTEYMAVSLDLVVSNLFHVHKLHKLELRAVDTDVPALSAALRCGFVEEGRRRQCRIVEGHWRDRVRMGLLESDPRPRELVSDATFQPRQPVPVDSDLPDIPTSSAQDFAVLRGERVTLRRKRPDDKQLFYRWKCRSEWWPLYMPQDPDGFSAPTRQEFEAKWRGDPTPHQWIVETEHGVPLGTCGYYCFDRDNRSAELAYLLYEAQYWRKGYATDAARRIVRHLFEDLKLHRVHSGTWAGNVGSLRVQQKSGLRIESHGRDCYLVDGKWYDGLGTGMLEEEYTP